MSALIREMKIKISILWMYRVVDEGNGGSTSKQCAIIVIYSAFQHVYVNGGMASEFSFIGSVTQFTSHLLMPLILPIFAYGFLL